MRQRGERNRRPSLWPALALVVCTSSHAAEFVPRAAFGVGWSDNPLRSTSGAEEETVLSAEAGFVWQRTGSRLNSDLAGTYTHREFIENTFDAEDLFNVRGYLDAVLVPGLLRWVVEEDFGQIASLPFGAILPTDREDANYLTTGPDLTFAFAGGDSLDLTVRASDVYYSESLTDNQRLGGQVSYVRALSPRRRLSANYYIGRVEFDRDDLYPRFDTQQAFLRLESEARRMTIAADVGWNRVELLDSADSGAFAALAVYRRVNAETLFSLQYSRGFSNSADSFRLDQSSLDTSLLDEDVQVAADPFDEDRLSASYQLNRTKVDLVLTAFALRERYLESVELDRDQIGFEGRVGYRWSPLSTISLLARQEENELLETGEKASDTQVTLEVGVQAARSVVLRFAIEQYRRDSRGGLLQDFTENRVFAGVAYAPPLPPRPQRVFRTRSLLVPGTNVLTD